MQKAPMILGYRDPYHYSSIYCNVKDCGMWIEAYNAVCFGKGTFGKGKWGQLLGHCSAVADTPCIQFTPQLIDAYPSAKVFLVERDIDSWYCSWVGFCDAVYTPTITILPWFDPWWYGRITGVGNMWLRTHMRGNTKQEALNNAKEVYREHYRMIRRITHERGIDILEYKLGSGWSPLCEFLNKPVPRDEKGDEVPFPYLNETESIQHVFVVMAKRSIGAATRECRYSSRGHDHS